MMLATLPTRAVPLSTLINSIRIQRDSMALANILRESKLRIILFKPFELPAPLQEKQDSYLKNMLGLLSCFRDYEWGRTAIIVSSYGSIAAIQANIRAISSNPDIATYFISPDGRLQVPFNDIDSRREFADADLSNMQSGAYARISASTMHELVFAAGTLSLNASPFESDLRAIASGNGIFNFHIATNDMLCI